MNQSDNKLRIALAGGGPAALFIYKRLVESNQAGIEIDIYEKGSQLGAGMPYSELGAGTEHITNVSGNEIPQLAESLSKWIRSLSRDTLKSFNIDPDNFNEFKTLPRLLFGRYLSDQFRLLQQQSKSQGISTRVWLKCEVTDISDDPAKQKVTVVTDSGEKRLYDRLIICTGHHWPTTYEGCVPGYYDSPYPPSKLKFISNHTIAIRGSSLTAIDAIRTIARNNGTFENKSNGMPVFVKNPDVPEFRIVIHSRSGLLPAVRFHLDDPDLGKNTVLPPKEVSAVRADNDGFLPLDYVFEKNFKAGIRKNDPDFYEQIRDLNMEAFVEHVMKLREKLDPFQLLKAEYTEAERSIRRKESVYWKEMLAILSFAMNYPAKYFAAEDMLRLKKVLMPLISVVIAFVPQRSAAEMMALHDAGCLEIVAVGDDSSVDPVKDGGAVYHYRNNSGEMIEAYYPVFIDCIGQPHLSFDDLPYRGLIENKTVSPARLKFKSRATAQKLMAEKDSHVVQDPSGNYYLTVPGIAINDYFQIVDEFNALNERIYIMAVPFIGGYNPDYSGLDFCNAASTAIIGRILSD